jgi:hypothetical protein
MRVPKAVAITWGAVSVLLAVLSIPTIPGQVSSWGPVLSAVDDDPLRWILPVIGWIGVVALLTYLLVERHRSRPDQSGGRHKSLRRPSRPPVKQPTTPLPPVTREELKQSAMQGTIKRRAKETGAQREAPPPQPHPPRKHFAPEHHVPVVLDQQRQNGQEIRDWLANGADPSKEPQPKQLYTAVIRTHPPESPLDSVQIWINETDAVLRQHAPAEIGRFLNDDGLSEGDEPISKLDRRIYRLEEIIIDLRAAG